MQEPSAYYGWHLDPDWTEGKHERGNGRCATSHTNFYASPLPTDEHCICLLLDPAAPVMQKAPSQASLHSPSQKAPSSIPPLIRRYATGAVVLKVQTLVLSLFSFVDTNYFVSMQAFWERSLRSTTRTTRPPYHPQNYAFSSSPAYGRRTHRVVHALGTDDISSTAH